MTLSDEKDHLGLPVPRIPLHCHLGCAAKAARHIEWFHDHVRIEQMLFDGAPIQQEGKVAPDPHRAGLGLTLKVSDAEKYRL